MLVLHIKKERNPSGLPSPCSKLSASTARRTTTCENKEIRANVCSSIVPRRRSRPPSPFRYPTCLPWKSPTPATALRGEHLSRHSRDVRAAPATALAWSHVIDPVQGDHVIAWRVRHRGASRPTSPYLREDGAVLLEHEKVPFSEAPISDQGVDIDQMVEPEEVALSHLARIG